MKKTMKKKQHPPHQPIAEKIKCTTCTPADYKENSIADYFDNGGTVVDLPKRKGGSIAPF